MPTVTQLRPKNRLTFVACPLESGSSVAYIPRDKTSWQVHMETSHAANSTSWTELGIRGSEDGLSDEKYGDEPYRKYAQICFGCLSTFATKTELVAHLLAIHGAS